MRLRAMFSILVAGFGLTFIFAGIHFCQLAFAEPQAAEQPAAEAEASSQKEIAGKVVGVTDGDTITVLDDKKRQHRVRLEGIDAPETGQPMGAKAKQALSGKVFDEQVVVKWRELDKYKRILGDVYLDDRHINHEMVEEGWAWHFKRYSKDADLADAETKARETKVGLWSLPNAVAPWEWRDRGKTKAAGKANEAKPKSGKSTARKKIEVAPSEDDESSNDAGDSTVYITRTGKKYHAAGCRYLSKSQIPIKLSDAEARGYTACSVCGGGGGEQSDHESQSFVPDTPSGDTTPTGKTIYTGPRGGRYHISKSGKKVYERKKR